MSLLTNSVSYSGNGLITGKESCVEILPKSEGTGIIFTDKNTKVSIKANVDNVLDTSHCVTIGNSKFQVRLIEHLMSVLALSNVKDAEIIIDGVEIPIGDGSGSIYHNLISEVALKSSIIDDKKYNISLPLCFNHKHTSIVSLPSDCFKVTYAVNFANSPYSYSWYKWDSSIDKPEDIISCRTFGYTRDLPVYQSMGLAMGVTIENTIGINDDGTLTTELRFDNEPVRHKVLDLIGDLYLTEINPLDMNVHIIAIECGHFQHVEMAKMLRSAINK